MKKAIYPGSFDPITNGHIDIIKRAARHFDEITVAILTNSSKTPLFSLEERVTMIKEVLKDLDNIKIDFFGGLMVDYTREHNIGVSIRGLRCGADFEYELQIAQNNYILSREELDTFFLPTDPKFSFISSSGVKEIARFHGDLTGYVPEFIEKKLQMKYNK